MVLLPTQAILQNRVFSMADVEAPLREGVYPRRPRNLVCSFGAFGFS